MHNAAVKLTVALILAEWAAGMVAGLAFVHRLHRIGPGFTWLVGGVASSVSGLAAWSGWREHGAAARSRTALAAALAAAAVAQVWQARRRRLPVDAAATATAAATAVAAGLAAGGGALSVARALAGAAFLGAVTVAMTVGHCYLVDPQLPRAV